MMPSKIVDKMVYHCIIGFLLFSRDPDLYRHMIVENVFFSAIQEAENLLAKPDQS
jgi:hypothetical protein